MDEDQLKRWPRRDNAFLGRGSFGSVERALYCGTPVAVKELLTGRDQMAEVRRQAKAELGKEIGILAEFRHPNIVLMIAHNSRYIVMQMYRGSASSIRSLDEVAVVARDCMRGIAYLHLHSKCVVHGDIKPDNILVETDSNGKITKAALGDVGLARACARAMRDRDFSGTPGYMPMPNPVVDSTHDIFALAVSVLDAFFADGDGVVHAGNDHHNLEDNTAAYAARLPDPDVRSVVSDMLAAYQNGALRNNAGERGEFIRHVIFGWEQIVSRRNVAASLLD
ncbi:unnamed protein product [Pylaiella littoralis]